MNKNRIASVLIALTLTAAVAAPASADAAAGKAKPAPKAKGFDSKAFIKHSAFPFVCRSRPSLC
jgi:hypothetical protein